MNRTQFGGLLSFVSLCLSAFFFFLTVISYQIKTWPETALGLFFLALSFLLARLGV